MHRQGTVEAMKLKPHKLSSNNIMFHGNRSVSVCHLHGPTGREARHKYIDTDTRISVGSNIQKKYHKSDRLRKE
jgi:hypothetical protein